MPNQSATQPLQTDTRTKKSPNRLEWKVPTLADLLQRLSVSSANPSFKALVTCGRIGNGKQTEPSSVARRARG